jgi:hypothetical protein
MTGPLDLKEAFDTVDHEILLSKLNTYGIEGMENNWFKSYLNSRNQNVLWMVAFHKIVSSIMWNPTGYNSRAFTLI